MGRIQQDEVGFMHDDQDVNLCQVWGGAPHLPPIFLGESEAHFQLELLVPNLQVADIGGTLGLFLGFSFLGLFDALVKISSTAVKFFIEIPYLARNIEV